MTYKTLDVRRDGHVAVIALARPRAGNAVNATMAEEMRDACRLLYEDDAVWAVLLTARGRHFCVGTDAAEERRLLKAGSPQRAEAIMARLSVASPVASLDRPVIAAIQGDALGQGLELALACDIRIVAAGARFAMPQVARGVVPWDGGTQRLPRVVGHSAAQGLLLGGQTLIAREALRVGLVMQVVPAKGLADAARAVAERLAGYAPFATRYLKETVRHGQDMTLEQGLRLEADLSTLLQTTRDRAEGIRAFFEKRSPKFEGR